MRCYVFERPDVSNLCLWYLITRNLSLFGPSWRLFLFFSQVSIECSLLQQINSMFEKNSVSNITLERKMPAESTLHILDDSHNFSHDQVVITNWYRFTEICIPLYTVRCCKIQYAYFKNKSDQRPHVKKFQRKGHHPTALLDAHYSKRFCSNRQTGFLNIVGHF